MRGDVRRVRSTVETERKRWKNAWLGAPQLHECTDRWGLRSGWIGFPVIRILWRGMTLRQRASSLGRGGPGLGQHGDCELHVHGNSLVAELSGLELGILNGLNDARIPEVIGGLENLDVFRVTIGVDREREGDVGDGGEEGRCLSRGQRDLDGIDERGSGDTCAGAEVSG